MGFVVRYFKRFYWFYLVIILLFTFTAIFTTEAVQTIGEMRQDKAATVLIVDPGHGGEDGGAVSCSGISESQINLEISLRVNDLLHLLGHPTVMTRSQDVSIHTQGDTIAQRKVSDIKNRVKLVNETPNGLLLSIHQNLFTDGKYSGAQVFYSPAGESKLLAESMQQALIVQLNRESHRCIKPADSVYLMQHINCTGILVECGFLSNSQEEAKLQTPEYQKRLSCVMIGVISQFLNS